MYSEQLILLSNLFLFIIGCSVGSFINVIIYRLPRGKSIIFPPSHCIKCKYKILWFDNIPLISWLLLRGKCRECKYQIAFTYPIFELISGLLFLLNSHSFGLIIFNNFNAILMIFSWAFVSMLFTLAILDAKYFWLPEYICRIGVFSGILFSAFIGIFYYSPRTFILVFDSISAAILGYLIFNFIIAIGFLIYQKPVMGRGDANLAAFLGSWLGVKALIFTIWLAFNFAGLFVIVGLIMKKLKRDQKIPFGTFLASSGIFAWYFGNAPIAKIIDLVT